MCLYVFVIVLVEFEEFKLFEDKFIWEFWVLEKFVVVIIEAFVANKDEVKNILE